MYSKKGFEELFWGLLISDGALRMRRSARNPKSKIPKKPMNANFYLSSRHKSFCEKMAKEFALHGYKGDIRSISSGKSMKKWERKRIARGEGPYTGWRFETRAYDYFTKAFTRWYPKKKKIVDRNFSGLGPIMLGYWLMGDGSNTSDHKHKNYGSRKITLSCESFKLNDQRFLVKELEKIGISSRIEKIRKNYRIAISQSKYVKKFLDIVECHVLPEFEYKLERPDLERESFTRYVTPKIKKLRKENPKKAKKIVEKLKNKQRKKRYNDKKSGIAKKAKDRAKKRYESMSQKEKATFLKQLRDKRAKKRGN